MDGDQRATSPIYYETPGATAAQQACLILQEGPPRLCPLRLARLTAAARARVSARRLRRWSARRAAPARSGDAERSAAGDAGQLRTSSRDMRQAA